MRAYKRTSSEQEVKVSDTLYGVNATKSKKIKEQERCETQDKNCVEIKKDINQSSPSAYEPGGLGGCSPPKFGNCQFFGEFIAKFRGIWALKELNCPTL